MLLEFLIALLLTGSILYGVWWFIWWIGLEKDTYKLSFKQFYSFYTISPNKWYLGDEHVSLRITGQFGGEKYQFRSFIDCLRYKRFRRKVEKNQEQQRELKSQQKLIDEMKKIIAEEEKKNQQWTQDKFYALDGVSASNYEWTQDKLKSNRDY